MKTPAGRTLGGWLAACAGATQMMAASGSVTLLDPSSGVVVPGPQVSFRAQVSDPAGLTSATLYLGAVGEAPTTLTFSGPAQTEDTCLDAGRPTSAFGSDTVLLVDAATPHAHAVIKFSTLIGNSPGQVPPGSSIQSATLRVNCFNLGNPLRICRLAEDWVESEATWNQRSAGVPWSNLGADGLLSHAATELSGDCSATGWRTIDVTTFVQDWSLGEANYGLVLIDSGVDGVDLDSSESLNPPALTVTFGSAKQVVETVSLSGPEQMVAFSPVGLTGQQSYVWNCLLKNELGEQTWAPADVQFTVDANYPDAPVLVAPTNGMVGVPTSPELRVQVSDPNGGTLSVSFYGRPKVNDAEEFVVVALPDTQYYSRDYPQLFAAQTTWIKNYKAQSNIVFVTHEGDVVNNFDSTPQFNNADAALSVLDGVVPYGLSPGNHDTPTTLFNQYFPYNRFEYPGGTQAGHYADNNDNNYHLFSAGGQDFLVLQLEYMPRAEVITWADSVLKANPNRKAIVTTHAYLDLGGNRLNPYSSNTTEYIWTDLVVPNPNVFFVLCGHVHGEYARTDVVDGREVHQLLADYQSEANGGNGWLRMLRFKPSLDQVWVETYSPSLDQYQTDANSYFARNFPMNGFRLIARQDNVSSGSTVSTTWSNLEMNRDYEWRVVVTDSTGRTTTGPTWQFKTVDPVPPAIHFVAASEVTETSTRIVWVTDEPATSVVDYGLDASHGRTVSDPSLVTDHSITLSGLTANTTYHYSVTSEDESGNATSSSNSFTTLRVNHAPVAVAQPVSTDEDVALSITLTGTDEDGDDLAYWVTSPPQYGTLTGSAPNITYTPAPNYYGGDSFQFEVNDGSATGGPATVSITVRPVNDPPMANAGPDQAADQNQMVTLDGSGSIDIDGPALTFQWRQISGSPSVALNNPSAAQPTFLAPPVVEETALVFELTVSGGISSSVDTTKVTVIPVDYDAYVEEAVLTLGTVAGGIEGTRLAKDGLTQRIVEASDRGGASLLIGYRLNTVAVPDQVSSMVLYLAAEWNPQDAGEPLYVGLNNVTTGEWEDISTLAQNGSFTVTAPEKYIDAGGDIRVRFFDGANVKREKKDTLTVDRLFADIEVGPPDTEPPAPPTGLSAVGGEYLVHLTWAPNAETDLAGYFVYRAAVSGGPYARLNASPIAATAFDDTGVLPGDPFYYVVRAVDSSGNESAPSGGASASSTDEAPSAPTGLTAVAGNGQVTLDWADNPEPDIVGYRVWRSLTSGGGYAVVGAGVIAGSAFVDSGLANGTTYYYLVTAVDALGHESPNSVEVSATPQGQKVIRMARIDMSASFAGKNWKATAQAVVLQQNDAPAAGATVVGDWYLGTGLIQAGATVLTDGSGSALFTSPPVKMSSGTFKFQVRSVQLAGAGFDAGQSVMSGAINVPLAPPAAPASLTASPVAATQISLIWADQSNNELQFRLERSTDGFKTVAEIILAANATQYIDTGLAPGTSYSYRLRACNDPGCSAYSTVATVTTPIPPPPPAAPGSLSAVTVASTQIRLAWIDQSDNESQFRLERSTDGFVSVVGTILAAGTTQYLDTGLAEGVTYSYRLRACNNGGCSSYSDAATASSSLGVAGAWTPLFKGIEHATGMTAVAMSPRQVVNVLRIDLQDTDIRVFSTPRSPNFVPDLEETSGLITSHFLTQNGLQVAINGNWFSPCCTGMDGAREVLLGLAISSSVVVSAQESALYSTAMVIASDKSPTMIGTNWPAANTSGLNTAVAGKNPLLYRGVYVGTNILVAPRTAMGVTKDKRYLLLMTIDGRQAGYSDGATDADTAAWMARFGANDAFNLDGGGSTTMAISDGQGRALVLNRPIHGDVSGTERAVANHFGVYAQPLASGASPLTSLTLPSRTTLTPAAEPLFQAMVDQMVDPTPELVVTHLGAGQSRISLRGTPDYTYRLQYSENLNSPIWQPLATVRANEIGLVDYIDTHAAAPRFYRALNP